MATFYDTHHMSAYVALAQTAGTTSLRAAAVYLTKLFDDAHIPVAIMGGYSIILRGSPRSTHDVDIAIGATMAAVRQALVGEQR